MAVLWVPIINHANDKAIREIRNTYVSSLLPVLTTQAAHAMGTLRHSPLRAARTENTIITPSWRAYWQIRYCEFRRITCDSPLFWALHESISHP